MVDEHVCRRAAGGVDARGELVGTFRFRPLFDSAFQALRASISLACCDVGITLAPSGDFNGVCRCWFVLVFQVDFSISVITTRFQTYLMVADVPRHRRGNWFGVAPGAVRLFYLTLARSSCRRWRRTLWFGALGLRPSPRRPRISWFHSSRRRLSRALSLHRDEHRPDAATAERHPRTCDLWQEL